MISGKKIHMTHEKNRIKKKAMWKKKLTNQLINYETRIEDNANALYL